MMRTPLLYFILALVWCDAMAAEARLSVVRESRFMNEDRAIELYAMTNAQGMCIKVTNYAASLTYVSAADRNGCFEPVVLGFDTLKAYLGRHPKFGATVGRFANRIKNAQFTLAGQTFQLDKNSKYHSIHGGYNGFHHQVFETDTCYVLKDTAVVVFRYLSPDSEGGFPGTLNLTVAYKLTNKNEVILDYTASTDKPTVINLTNHTYFNLSGAKESVLNHRFLIQADAITPVDSTGVPTGELKKVAGTEYDFSVLRNVEAWVQKTGKGYDINYQLNKQVGLLAAVVVEPMSGRVLKAYTTEPGMQFYIPHSNMSYLTGHSNRVYGQYWGFCLEMQHFPDSPNHPHFPTTTLLPGKTYRQTTIYKFETLTE